MIKKRNTTHEWDLQKQQLQAQLEAKAKDIRKRIETLREPDSNATLQERWISNIGRGVAIADGLLTGYRLYKRASKFLPTRLVKRKKK